MQRQLEPGEDRQRLWLVCLVVCLYQDSLEITGGERGFEPHFKARIH